MRVTKQMLADEIKIMREKHRMQNADMARLLRERRALRRSIESANKIIRYKGTKIQKAHDELKAQHDGLNQLHLESIARIAELQNQEMISEKLHRESVSIMQAEARTLKSDISTLKQAMAVLLRG